MSAVQSGLITFASSAGSMAMKIVAKPVLYRYGFRNVMIWNGLTSTIFLGIVSMFRPGWPVWTIYAVLLVGGFFQSLQFIAYNTIAYADVPRATMSAATSFYTTFQQLSLTLGIAVSAASLAGSMAWRGHPAPLLADFSTAFLIVATVSIFAPLLSATLDRGAGAELSGHHVMGRPRAK